LVVYSFSLRLLDRLERIYKEHIIPGHVKALDGHNPDGTLE
jgi:hypothetical protein